MAEIIFGIVFVLLGIHGVGLTVLGLLARANTPVPANRGSLWPVWIAGAFALGCFALSALMFFGG